MTKGKRVDVINKLIDDKNRPSENISNRLFFGCEICYTCKFFNIFTSECFISYDDAVKKLDSNDSRDVREKEYFIVPTRIKDPMYYRCEGWEDGE